MQGLWKVLSKAKHLCFFVCTRSRGVGGPFLVPIRKGTVSHTEGVHSLSGHELGVDGNEMGFKGCFKLVPGAEVGGVKRKGCFLAILGPFASRRTEFEVGERGSDALIFIGIYVTIQEVVGIKEGPKGFSFVSGAVEGFWDGAQNAGG